SSEDDYKLLSVQKSHHYVYIYSLKSDSWRKVDALQSTHILNHWGLSRGTYLNENLYFLQHHERYRQLPSIIRFDTKTERLSKIETPNVDEAYHYFATIVVKSDCIHVCVKHDTEDGFGITTDIELWKLDEYENLEKVLTLQLRPLKPQHVYVIPFISLLRPFYLMKNGNWLMVKNRWRSYKHKIFKVDLNDNDSEDPIKVKVDVKYNIVLEEVIISKEYVYPKSNGYLYGQTDVVQKLQASKLRVYVQKMSNDFISIPWDFFTDPYVEIHTYVTAAGVDGVVTDYPATASGYRNSNTEQLETKMHRLQTRATNKSSFYQAVRG
ncbi:glycerophosphodiester phosphodiesterase GDPDL3-like protein, partial [Tanacetum coccineum]